MFRNSVMSINNILNICFILKDLINILYRYYCMNLFMLYHNKVCQNNFIDLQIVHKWNPERSYEGTGSLTTLLLFGHFTFPEVALLIKGQCGAILT